MTADSQTQRIFLALADPTRRLLLQLLCEEGSGTAAGFAARLPMTRQAITKHLLTLEQAKLVTARETGRERRYEPRPEALLNVTTWIGALEAQWDQRVAALRSLLLDEQLDEQFTSDATSGATSGATKTQQAITKSTESHSERTNARDPNPE